MTRISRTGRPVCVCGKGWASKFDNLCTNCRGGKTGAEAAREAATFTPSKMTYSGLQRFAEAVGMVMNADQIAPLERLKLIGYWAYQFQRPDMPQQLKAAIKRCQDEHTDPDNALVTATSKIDCITGEVVAYNPEGRS